jgi:hypothetical protein
MLIFVPFFRVLTSGALALASVRRLRPSAALTVPVRTGGTILTVSDGMLAAVHLDDLGFDRRDQVGLDHVAAGARLVGGGLVFLVEVQPAHAELVGTRLQARSGVQDRQRGDQVVAHRSRERIALELADGLDAP